MMQPVATEKAPGAVGPYSQGMDTGTLVFASGQLPLHPETRTMPADIGEQAAQSLENLKAVLEAAGSGLGKVVKTSVFLADLSDFAAVNEVYAKYFSPPFPARSCFQVAALPLGARVEIEAIALK